MSRLQGSDGPEDGRAAWGVEEMLLEPTGRQPTSTLLIHAQACLQVWGQARWQTHSPGPASISGKVQGAS